MKKRRVKSGTLKRFKTPRQYLSHSLRLTEFVSRLTIRFGFAANNHSAIRVPLSHIHTNSSNNDSRMFYPNQIGHNRVRRLNVRTLSECESGFCLDHCFWRISADDWEFEFESNLSKRRSGQPSFLNWNWIQFKLFLKSRPIRIADLGTEFPTNRIVDNSVPNSNRIWVFQMGISNELYSVCVINVLLKPQLCLSNPSIWHFEANIKTSKPLCRSHVSPTRTLSTMNRDFVTYKWVL